MRVRTRRLGLVIAAACELTIAPHAWAIFSPAAVPCRNAFTKASEKFLKKNLRATQKCNDRNLRLPGDCVPADLAARIVQLEDALRSSIEEKCGPLPAPLVATLGFPGRCNDSDPFDGFTPHDLETCMLAAHEATADDLIDLEYAASGVLDGGALACQTAIAKNGARFADLKLKAIQSCRSKIDRGRLFIRGEDCATSDPITVEKIAKAESTARAGIARKCDATQVQALGICANPACVPFCGICDPTCVADCIIATHEIEIDDLIDAEYPRPPICGDEMLNQVTEECDGSDNAMCPGECGAPDGLFPCLCESIPRERVLEHADGADLDIGWTGQSHDLGVVDGAGYVVDLFDCDGPGGPNTLCTVGPSCSGDAHSACTTDAQCAALGQGTCRKSQVDVGPHCSLDLQTACANDGDCPGVGNVCLHQFHGPPLPLAAGGLSVCVVNVFTEDVTGTRDLATGAGAVRLREKAITYLTGTPSRPCPVCGGFCAATAGSSSRHQCTNDADCADVLSHKCVRDPVCSTGPNVDKQCRPDPPFGGPTTVFGNPSVDCPPDRNADVSNGGLDILFDSVTTGIASMLPTVQCADPSFASKTCAGGANNGASCTLDAQCPGATCSFQCYCGGAGGSRQSRPNACDPACVGGPNDTAACGADSECPGGFCHPADCRPDPIAPAALQPYEGACTISHENCFVNAGTTSAGITRAGVVDPTDPVSAAVSCIDTTTRPAVDSTGGLPGPVALRVPTTVVRTGF